MEEDGADMEEGLSGYVRGMKWICKRDRVKMEERWGGKERGM